MLTWMDLIHVALVVSLNQKINLILIFESKYMLFIPLFFWLNSTENMLLIDQFKIQKAM